MKDFFISYTRADSNWAEWVAWQLEEAGYAVDIQVWDSRPSHDFIAEMDRASREAERTLAVLTPKYFESRFTQAEWTPAFAKGSLLPVRVADFDVEGLLSVRVYIDLVGKDETQAKEALLTGIKLERRKPAAPPAFPRLSATERLVTEPPRFPGALPAIWNVPHQRNPNFVGRDMLLDQVRQTLIAETAAALTAIHGLGGVGKSQLAAEYAYRHAADYQLVWWIRSEEAATFASDYVGLAAKLELPEKDEREQRVVATAVREWLNHNADWLLVLDNARSIEDLQECLPQSRAGHVLITSRNPNWGRVARALEVEVLDREASVKFLVQRTGQTDERAASLLADELGDLPLALEQAGAYIEATGESLAGYRKMFQTSWRELLLEGKPDDYPDTVAVTWRISFDRAQEESPAAGELLNLCVFLAPDDIPLSILRDGVNHLWPPLAEVVADKLAFNKAIAALRRYSLVERNDESLSVHRLVQLVARDRLPIDEQGKWAEAAVRVVNTAFPQESSDVRTWAKCAQLLHHAAAVVESGERLQVDRAATARLANQTGLYFHGRAQYAEAKQAFERALRLNEAVFGSNHPSVATNLNNLGNVLQDLSDLAGAWGCYKRALRIDQADFGFNHPNVVRDLNNLGTVLRDLENFAEARQFFELALQIVEVVYGTDHRYVAAAASNLGAVLGDLEDLTGAQLCFERALRTDEAASGSDHPDVAIDVNNLGNVLQKLGHFAQARQCFERALRIDKAAFGNGHPRVAVDLNNLGNVLKDLRNLAEARSCYEQALQVFEKVLGANHPYTVGVGNSLEELKRAMR